MSNRNSIASFRCNVTW